MAIHDLRLTRHATVNKTHMIKAKKKKTVQTKVKKNGDDHRCFGTVSRKYNVLST